MHEVLVCDPTAAIPQICEPHFDHLEPFIFRCNAGPQQWTPQLLKERLGVNSFGKLKGIIVEATSSNLTQVMRLAIWWSEFDFPVTIVFPEFTSCPPASSPDDDSCLGMDAEECYEFTGGKWRATHEFRREVGAIFKGDKLIKIDMETTISAWN